MRHDLESYVDRLILQDKGVCLDLEGICTLVNARFEVAYNVTEILHIWSTGRKVDPTPGGAHRPDLGGAQAVVAGARLGVGDELGAGCS